MLFAQMHFVVLSFAKADTFIAIQRAIAFGTNEGHNEISVLFLGRRGAFRNFLFPVPASNLIGRLLDQITGKAIFCL